MEPDSDAPDGVEFGRFRILPRGRQLLADGSPVELGGRAFDLLLALLEAPGTILSSADLMRRVWFDRVVDENSLQVQISALRKALEPERDLIRTVAGRGYQFTGDVRGRTGSGESTAIDSNLPARVGELIGRDAELREVAELARQYRLLTLAGPGGIGKTRLSIEAGRQVATQFAHGTFIVELAPLTDPALIASAVAAAVGLALPGGATPERVASALGQKEVLLILDNCEQVIEGAARFAFALLRTSGRSRVIATSREPLAIEGEFVYRVAPLEVSDARTADFDSVLRTSAVRLFVARVQAAQPDFVPDAAVATLVADVCRRLDGIPLAIELAAARASALGLEALAAGLDQRFRVLTEGRRTALARHQTLRAALDWSHELLSAPERVVLRRLATFAGSFNLDQANAVVASDEVPVGEVLDTVTNLVAKSLIAVDASAPARYRLLETTRAYALERLEESAERGAFARRHAAYFMALFERAEVQSRTQAADAWLAAFGDHLDNLRGALDWAFSASGDGALGVALTVAAVPLWMHRSLVGECRQRVEQALASLAAGGGHDRRRAMQLQAALGAALLYANVGPEVTATWTGALARAEELDDVEYQLRALWGCWADQLNNGHFLAALDLARRFHALAERSDDANDRLIGDRLIGFAQHCLGNQVQARRHTEQMLARYATPARGSPIIRYQFDQRVVGNMALALISWVQGYPDQAMRAVETSVAEALAARHVLSQCIALAQAACPVALYTGDLVAAERFVNLLLATSAQHALDSWEGLGTCFKGVLLVKRGDVAGGVRVLRDALAALPEFRHSVRYTALLAEFAIALGLAGETANGLSAIDETMARCERSEERWSFAELERIKGELILLHAGADAEHAAENCFLSALDWARRQRALAWELRSAISLARLWQPRGRAAAAREMLAGVCSRFTEGFATADWRAAQHLLGAPA